MTYAVQEEFTEMLVSEREEVRKLLESIIESETHLVNQFILADAARQLYAHAKTIAAIKAEMDA